MKTLQSSIKITAKLIRRHPLSTFFVLAYLGSWLVWSPWWLSRSGLGVLSFDLPANAHLGINQLGLFAGPFAAAFIVTRIADGRKGVHRFIRRFIQWRELPRWYLLALLVIPVAISAGYLLVSNSIAMPEGGGAAIGAILGTYFVYLLGGPIQEEPGWRGFALPRLQQRLKPISAAVILGIIHTFWHLPLFFTQQWDTPRDNLGQLFAYLLLVVSMSVVMSWLVNSSRGSLLLAILGHNGINWGLFVAAAFTGQATMNTWPATLGMTLLAIIAIFITRGRLGLNNLSSVTSPAQ